MPSPMRYTQSGYKRLITKACYWYELNIQGDAY
jgi:hypothetical protein